MSGLNLIKHSVLIVSIINTYKEIELQQDIYSYVFLVTSTLDGGVGLSRKYSGKLNSEYVC